MSQPFRLDNKHAVITGAGSGIGLATAKLFASQGAHVAILDKDEKAAHEASDAIHKDGHKALFMGCDVADSDSVKEVFDAVAGDLGSIDILVNNAGIAHVGTVENTAEEDFDRLYQVNVKGVYLCTQAALPYMQASGGGVILNMASIASMVGVAERFAYSMTKGAVLTMTKSVALDYVKQNIRCNCVCPARVHTPFVDGFIKKNYPGKEDEKFKELSEFQPLGRMARPEEVAALGLYLCSDEAGFITGQAYAIDGGVLNQ